MTIEIGQLDHSTDGYYVRITERLAEPDALHRTDKITTSPSLPSQEAAKGWLMQWLRLS